MVFKLLRIVDDNLPPSYRLGSRSEERVIRF